MKIILVHVVVLIRGVEWGPSAIVRYKSTPRIEKVPLVPPVVYIHCLMHQTSNVLIGDRFVPHEVVGSSGIDAA